MEFRILVTGGAGFIGSEFVRQAVSSCYKVIVLDKLNYAGDLSRLQSLKGKYKFYKCDICNQKLFNSILKREKPSAVVNFAAETHVDRSIQDATPFIETNIRGVQVILESVLDNKIGRFLQISTDEVYGEIKKGSFSETSPLQASSPYAASKAAADLLIKSYIRTYSLPVIIVRPCNNYGPWQYPEKMIPVAITSLFKGKKIPIYAKGENVREWLFVSDCARGILLILKRGRIGQVYNLGSGQERKNIDTAKEILKVMGRPINLIEFVKDRPGHDLRYSLNSSKIRNELGWSPRTDMKEGIKNTVEWYLNNQHWINRVIKGERQ